jgi:hypothetical protein
MLLSEDAVACLRVSNSLFVTEPLPDLDRPIKARDLQFEVCDKALAVHLCRAWHSRLPNTQMSPWQFAFRAHRNGVTYAVALWNNPSARMLPSHWLELRRMACAPDAPFNTASAFLGWMARYFAKEHPLRERMISYQDTAVHQGTIYKAAGWEATYTSKPRIRDRSKLRAGTDRLYRSNINGVAVDASSKVRWEKVLEPPPIRRTPLGRD